MELNFVYLLSYKGIIFYVGMTIDPFRRYVQHCTGDTATWGITNLIRERGEMFDFRIVFVCETEREALRRESQLIKLYAQIGIALCNGNDNPPENRITYYYHWSWRPERRNLNHTAIKQHIADIIKKYDNGQFRYDCMAHATSLG